MPEHRISDAQRLFARGLRREETSLEGLLWRELRGRRLDGWKFRRQVPVEGYVVDFLCPAARLIVEAHGPHHDGPGQRAKDGERDRVLRCHRFRVLRFPGELILSDLARVVAAIRLALDQSPHPSPDQGQGPPSPAWGRGGSLVLTRRADARRRRDRMPKSAPSPLRKKVATRGWRVG